jgi:hypothetical protein
MFTDLRAVFGLLYGKSLKRIDMVLHGPFGSPIASESILRFRRGRKIVEDQQSEDYFAQAVCEVAGTVGW